MLRLVLKNRPPVGHRVGHRVGHGLGHRVGHGLGHVLSTPQEISLSVSKVLGAINIPGTVDECECQVASFLTDFILESSLVTLKKFLTFVTGHTYMHT